ncbi:MAG: hypothetical protein IIY44_03295 [Erysipelotrichales bacterium]|nr:hypothetical protein [Erysipelotrichales bacterium]MBQ2310835.1 hypothetical protein [Erysipelotrichales bacterium]MBQ2478854.1 hypothetical protein [Erysipelotrichales bacterium]MBQ4011161.1 hypothetical protein [Erysipelotrichales bacterium]MBQ5541977.1 hypothetical protein [Erysipelotrichales bacterium]
MFTKILRWIVTFFSKIHDKVLTWNDNAAIPLNDKQLHFLIIGVLGMLVVLMVYPLFKWLAKKNALVMAAGFYSLTVMIVITFAIEIGQRITGTGVMEFDDIVAGIAGFIFLFCVFLILRGIVLYIRRFFRERKA